MIDPLATLQTLVNLGLFLLGFGFIVFVHEMGHFLAARWAGVRVLAFAIGFGPAAASYRQGMGLRRGSSEREYRALVDQGRAAGLSPTEYRFNWLPFGGYVKMLGQEDLHPDAVSPEPDSYQNCPPWKRLVIISAGVVMNVVLAAALFVLVFMVGLKMEPARVGSIEPGSPASRAVAANASVLGVTEPGLKPGDEILRIDGEVAHSFNDVVLASSTGKRGKPIALEVRRAGVDGTLEFRIVPEEHAATRLLHLGFEPARSARVVSPRTKADAAELERRLAQIGLPGVQAGMRVVRAGENQAVGSWAEVQQAIRDSGGRPVSLSFASDSGAVANAVVTPRPAMQQALLEGPGGRKSQMQHLLGFTPVMKVGECREGEHAGYAKGLRTGDIFLRIGSAEYPSLAQGMDEIRARAGHEVPVVVLRKGDDGQTKEVALSPKVSDAGAIGFIPDDTGEDLAMVSFPPSKLVNIGGSPDAARPAAWGVITTPGTWIDFVDGRAVANFPELRSALRDATADALAKGEGKVVRLGVGLPRAGQAHRTDRDESIDFPISAADVKALHALSWEAPFGPGLFEPAQTIRKAASPADAISIGLHETHRVMMTTYITFVRLFEQSVKVEHLKGPVGIAHMGTLIADRGFIWLLFFLALISVNLAVINFLPLPIVDGGQFLLILFEMLRGRPAPLAVQNGLTLAGLVLIGSIFLVVTFNDVRNLFGL